MTQASDRITRLRSADRPAWDRLWEGYLTFYRVPLAAVVTESTWRRIFTEDGLFALAIRPDGDAAPIGIAHYLFHPTTWSVGNVCYLEDLFVAPAERGRGRARALIDAVAADASSRGVGKLYWLTQEANHTARRLYDAVAANSGFIRYDYAHDRDRPEI